MTTRTELDLQGALLTTGLVCPISSASKSGYIEVLSRQVQGQEGNWLKAVDAILTQFESLPKSEVHICRRYVRANGRLAFGWHLSITAKPAKGLTAAVKAVTDILSIYKATLVAPESTVDLDAPVAPAMMKTRKKVLAPGEHPAQKVVHPRQAIPSHIPGNEGISEGEVHIKVVQHTVGEDGKLTHIDEMPLPHVHSEMNKPNAKGRGAKKVG